MKLLENFLKLSTTFEVFTFTSNSFTIGVVNHGKEEWEWHWGPSKYEGNKMGCRPCTHSAFHSWICPSICFYLRRIAVLWLLCTVISLQYVSWQLYVEDIQINRFVFFLHQVHFVSDFPLNFILSDFLIFYSMSMLACSILVLSLKFRLIKLFLLIKFSWLTSYFYIEKYESVHFSFWDKQISKVLAQTHASAVLFAAFSVFSCYENSLWLTCSDMCQDLSYVQGDVNFPITACIVFFLWLSELYRLWCLENFRPS